MIVAISVEVLSSERVTATQKSTTQVVCPVSQISNAEQLFEKGREMYAYGQFTEALDCWQKAADMYKHSNDKNRIKVIISQINQSQALQALGLYPRACTTILEAFRLQENEFKFGEQSNIGFQNDCRELIQLNEYERRQFIKVLEKSFQSINQVGQLSGSVISITGLRSFGDILRALGNLDLSYDILKKSLDITQRSQDMAAVYLSLGNTTQAFSKRKQDFYSRTQTQTDLQAALDDANKALKYYEQAYEKAKDNPAILSTQIQARLNQLSLVLNIEQWLQNIQVKTQKEWQPPSQNLNNKINEIQQQIDKWLPQFEKYVRTWSEIEYLSDKSLPNNHESIYTQLNLVTSLICLYDLAKSANAPMSTQATSSTFLGCLNHSINGQNSRLAGVSNYPKIMDIKSRLEKLIRQAKAIGDLKAEAYAQGYLGILYEQKEDWLNAKNQLQLAVGIAASNSSPDIAYLWQWELGHLLKEHGDIESAITHYTAAYEILKSLRSDLAAINPDVQFSFREAVEPVYRKLVDLLLRSDKPNLKLAREVIDNLQIAELDNFFQEACSKTVQTSIDKIIEEDKHAAILYPIILEDRIEIILKLPGDTQLYRYTTDKNVHGQPLTKDSIENTFRQLRYYLEQPFFSSKRGKSAAELVYDWVIRKAEDNELRNHPEIKTLLFVLNDSLRNIPMAALRDSKAKNGEGEYLIEKYAIAVTPGLQLLVPKADEQLNQFKNGLVAGLSVPPSEKDKQEGFGHLQLAEAEVKEVENILKDSEELLDTNFNSNNLPAKLSSFSYNIVHLTTHGQFSFNRKDTFILTASRKQAGFEKINLDKLKTLLPGKGPTYINLLVLNACETATGDERDVLGIAGVAVGAGARSTIAALWSIGDDRSTFTFTKKFYTELKYHYLSKAEALRKAQLSLLKSGYKLSQWTPYILVGDWR